MLLDYRQFIFSHISINLLQLLSGLQLYFSTNFIYVCSKFVCYAYRTQ